MGYGGTKEERHEKNRRAQVRYLSDPVKKAAHAARVAVRGARVYAEHRAIINAAKDVDCPDCGGRFPPECYDFDHVRGEKLINVSSCAGAVSTRKLLEEMAKCDVVCANCHRIRTARRLREGM